MKQFSRVETNLADEFSGETICVIIISNVCKDFIFVTFTGTDEFGL